MIRFERLYKVAICAVISILGISTTSTRTRNLLRLTVQNEIQTRSKIVPYDIHVPADMWRRPSQTPYWEPVSLPNCCAKPRAMRSLDTHTSKFYGGCSLENESVRYYGPGMDYSPDDLNAALRAAGGDLVILGDSLSRQWFQQLACYLGTFKSWAGFVRSPIEYNRAALEAKITESFMRYRPDYRSRGNNLGEQRPNETTPFSSFGAFQVPTEREGAPKQRVMFQSLNGFGISDMLIFLRYFDQEYPRDFSRKRPIFVINIGLHYNIGQSINHYGNPGSENDLQKNLGLLSHYCHAANARCIFRETSPQHFDTEANDGLWPLGGGKENMCMSQPPDSFTTLSRWRNDLLHEHVKEKELGKNSGFVKIMPLFDKLAGLDVNHHKGLGDCTHFKMDPEIWEPWHVSLTKVLLDVTDKVVR